MRVFAINNYCWCLGICSSHGRRKKKGPLEAPTPSTATSSTTTANDKPNQRRGQYGRHKKHDDVHVIAQVGP